MAWKKRNHPRRGMKIEDDADGECLVARHSLKYRRQDADNAANSRYHSRYELFIPRENEVQPLVPTRRTCFIVATWRFPADHCYATPRGATGPSLLAIIELPAAKENNTDPFPFLTLSRPLATTVATRIGSDRLNADAPPGSFGEPGNAPRGAVAKVERTSAGHGGSIQDARMHEWIFNERGAFHAFRTQSELPGLSLRSLITR